MDFSVPIMRFAAFREALIAVWLRPDSRVVAALHWRTFACEILRGSGLFAFRVFHVPWAN